MNQISLVVLVVIVSLNAGCTLHSSKLPDRLNSKIQGHCVEVLGRTAAGLILACVDEQVEYFEYLVDQSGLTKLQQLEIIQSCSDRFYRGGTTRVMDCIKLDFEYHKELKKTRAGLTK